MTTMTTIEELQNKMDRAISHCWDLAREYERDHICKSSPAFFEKLRKANATKDEAIEKWMAACDETESPVTPTNTNQG